MKNSLGGAAFLLAVGVVMIASGALAQRAADEAAVKAPVAKLSFSHKSLGFGTVKGPATKSLTIKNKGTLTANLTVSGGSAPYSVVQGSGSTPLAPGGSLTVSVLFGPTSDGTFKSTIAAECDNCVAADNNVEIKLNGKAKDIASASPTPAPGTANALPIAVTEVNSLDTFEEPLVSVTICNTANTECTTVNDILLDTASFGLRIFGSQITGLGIAPNTNGGSEIGECAFFGSSTTWGAVSTVNVKMAGEAALTIPIQVIDDRDAFAPAPRACTSAGAPLITSPQEAHFNGILGVGQVSNDLVFTDYFNCAGENCSSVNPPAADIVPNPVSALPVDNNGVVVSLPSVPASGAKSANGTLFFGIGTESNNQPGSVNTLLEGNNLNNDPSHFLDVNTVYKGVSGASFFDTGSNGLFFNDASIAQCGGGSVGFYCPSSTLSESATNESIGSSVSSVVNFQIANANNLFNSGAVAVDDVGGTNDGGSTFDGFDWGLPFFFGRTVFIGMSGVSSPLGTGPYTAY